MSHHGLDVVHPTKPWLSVSPAKAREIERKMEMEDGRLSGTEFAGQVPGDEDYIKAIVELMDKISPSSYKLSTLGSMEQVMVGVFARMYHLMIAKQLDYGPDNITKAGIRGIVTRANDKIERLKTLVGDPDDQMRRVQDVLEEVPDDASYREMGEALMSIQRIVVPENAVKGESVEDTLLDLANYGLIGYMLYMGAWPKPLERGGR